MSARLEMVRLPDNFRVREGADTERRVFHQAESFRPEGENTRRLRVEVSAWTDPILDIAIIQVDGVRLEGYKDDFEHVIRDYWAAYRGGLNGDALVQREAIRLFDEARAKLVENEVRS